MSIKCNKCENKIFDSNAYLKMSIMERNQQENINEIKNKIQNSKEVNEEFRELLIKLKTAEIILKTIKKCKNSLY